MAIYRVEHKKDYTVVKNFICKDKRLSWKAKGIWLYAFSRPDDWQFNLSDLINQSTDAKDSVTTGLKELEKFGYLLRDQKREAGKFSNSEWVFYETPQDLKECLPKTDFPSTVNSETVNPPLLSTEELSTENNQQQIAAVTSKSSKKEKPKVYPCLFEIDIPLYDKIEITKTYELPTVINAIEWAGKQKSFTKGLVAAIKHACKRNIKHEEPKPKETPYEKLCKDFKHGEKYNGAECYLTKEYIAFQRGMKHEEVELNKFFSWEKLNNLCKSFGIEFNLTEKNERKY